MARSSLLLAVALVGLSAAPACAQRNSVSVEPPSRYVLNRLGLERAWWSHATMDASRDKVRYLTNDEQYVYVQSTAGTVTSFDGETGRRVWDVQLSWRDQASQPLVTNDELVLVPVAKTLYALDRLTGRLLWELQLPLPPSTQPALDDARVYFGTYQGDVYAFDLRKIAELHRKSMLPQYSGSALTWRYSTSKQITTPPIADGRLVQFASMNGSLYSVEAKDRELMYQFETDAPISAPLAYFRGYLFLASEDFNFYCLNEDNGRVRWEFVSGLPIRTAPQPIGDDVFLTPVRGGMYALSIETGKPRWWRPDLTNFVAATQRAAFATDRAGNLQMLSRDDGAVLGVIPTHRFDVKPPNARTDRVYIATDSGQVMCLREIGSEFPQYHLHPERRPILPLFAPENVDAEPPAAGLPADPPPAKPDAPPQPNENP